MADDHSSSTHPKVPDKPGKNTWFERLGFELPRYVKRIARHIHADSGYSWSNAIASAINRVKELAAKGNRSAIRALAQWNRMKAKASHAGFDETGLVALCARHTGLDSSGAAASIADDRDAEIVFALSRSWRAVEH